MKFALPDAATIKEIGDQLGFRMDEEYIKQVRTFMGPFEGGKPQSGHSWKDFRRRLSRGVARY